MCHSCRCQCDPEPALHVSKQFDPQKINLERFLETNVHADMCCGGNNMIIYEKPTMETTGRSTAACEALPADSCSAPAQAVAHTGLRHMVTDHHSSLGMAAAAAVAAAAFVAAAASVAAGRKLAGRPAGCSHDCSHAEEAQCTGHSCWQVVRR